MLRVTPGAWDAQFASEPCVLKDGDRWVMFYSGLAGRHAQDGVAVSADLDVREKDPEPVVRHGEPGSLDATHAHKPSVIMRDGVLYHYCVAGRPVREGDPTTIFGGEFRTICVAASAPW